MDKFVRKTLFIILMVYAAAFTALFVYSILSFHGIYIKAELISGSDDRFRYGLSLVHDYGRLAPSSETGGILASFKLRWILDNSIILFSDYLPAIHLSAVFICFSLIFPYSYSFRGSKSLFINMLGKSIVIFLVLTFIFTGIIEGVNPHLKRKQKDLSALSRMAAVLFEEGKEALSEDNYALANGCFSSYLDIDRENSIIKEAEEWTAARMLIKPLSVKPASVKSVSSGENRMDLYREARNYYDRGEWFSAYYYAFLASQTEEGDLKEKALRLMAASEEKLSGLVSADTDKRKNSYYKRKLKALNALRAGNSYYAYYAFKDLHRDYPDDKDISFFFARSKKAVEKDYFFLDEIEKVKDLSGVEDILYSTRSNDGSVTFVKIGKYVETAEGRYFFNVEILKMSPGGGLLSHYRAPYGKLSNDGYLVLKAMDRNKEMLYGPVFLDGTVNAGNPEAEKLVPDPDDLVFLKKTREDFSEFSLVDLLRMRGTVRKFGYLDLPVDIYILRRILNPFTFFIFSLFAVGIGWFFRNGENGFPVLSLPFIPLIPFIVHRILTLYFFSSDILYSYVLFKTGFTVSLILMAAVQGILLFLALLVIIGNERS